MRTGMMWKAAAAASLSVAFQGAAPGRQADVPDARAGGEAARSEAEQLVLDLMRQDFQAQMKASPLEASRRGLPEFEGLLPDVSEAARTEWLAGARERLARLEAIELSELSPAMQLNARLLAYEQRVRLEAERFAMWQMPVTQQAGPQRELPQLPDTLSFTTAAQLEGYVRRLEAVDTYIEGVIANMRAGLAAGRTPPRVVMGTTVDQALSQAEERFAADPSAHPMFRPLAGAPAELRERGERAIRGSVVPAFAKLGAFLRDEYLPGCRESIAATSLPDGAAFYQFLIRVMTTTALTAQQIHDMGLREVARIRAEMMEVIGRSDFSQKAELEDEELFRAFIAHLRTDARFYHASGEELLAGYREIAKRVDPELPRFFRTLPRLPYGVREMPRFIAPSAPTAYYYPGSLETGLGGYFVANTYRLDQRPKYEMIALTLHEAAPGHHLQIALAQELTSAGLPEWRTTVDYTVFVEGWALYAERLGLEMGDDARSAGNPDGRGLYADPYDDFGRLTYEMWRAMRLVVDTGMHALGWTRQQAIDYMLANSALTPTNIEREVDRYIAWPGQALAYKIGELRIRALRADAEAELGERFDIRSFHDAVLMQGAVPLEILEAQVRAWIAERARTEPALEPAR
ncbi:MAG: DUF885 domain-containing protein [Planctomycetota bacterium]|nr:DUF885 domain-containing protein [Planctomycetota bacterium]